MCPKDRININLSITLYDEISPRATFFKKAYRDFLSIGFHPGYLWLAKNTISDIVRFMSGMIDISQLQIPPEKHELATARYFSEKGKDIVFIRPSNIPKVHRPDILMDGIEWERNLHKGRQNEPSSKTSGRQSSNRCIKSLIYDVSMFRKANVYTSLKKSLILDTLKDFS